MTITTEKEPLRLEEKMEWPLAIVNSVIPGNLVPPVRSILRQLLDRFQEDKFSRYAQSVHMDPRPLVPAYSYHDYESEAKGKPSCRDMIQMVATDYAGSIEQEVSSTYRKTENELSRPQGLCPRHHRTYVLAGYLWSSSDRLTILGAKTLHRNSADTNSDLWRMSTKHLKRSNHLLATSILSGITGILGLEEFTSRQIKDHHQESGKLWNNALQQVIDYVCNNLLEAVEQFEEESFQNLLQEAKAIRGLIFLLFSGESRVHQGSLNIFKRLASATDRRDSLMHILTSSYWLTMPSITQALGQFHGQGHIIPAPWPSRSTRTYSIVLAILRMVC